MHKLFFIILIISQLTFSTAFAQVKTDEEKAQEKLRLEEKYEKSKEAKQEEIKRLKKFLENLERETGSMPNPDPIKKPRPVPFEENK